MSFHRRDFLTGTAAIAAGMTAALVGAERVDAGDPSFMNNVPDPLLSDKELPTFKFALEKSKGPLSGQNTAKEATVRQLPISKGIAGVSMGLGPGAMRELHWHATAAEWAFVDEGRVRTTVTGPSGYEETNDFEPGDVWYFPRGHAHVLECLADQPCPFILMFDNGYFSEFGTFSITDWIGHTPKALLAKNFGVPESTFDGFPKKFENVGDKPCRVLIGFNSGVYEEIDLSEWMSANPPDVLATNFGKPGAVFEKFP